MSAASILKSMKNAPKLEKATFNRWSTHFLDVLSIHDVEKHILEHIPALSISEKTNTPDPGHAIRKQDQNIRIAISQLVPDVVFHLVSSTFSAKECWDNLRNFYCPNPEDDIEDLLQGFWGLEVEDDVDVDEFVQKLSNLRSKISIIDSKSEPTDSNVKKRVLSHFIKCCNGFYMSLVVPLRDSTVTLQSAVSSIRSSQEVYRQLHAPSVVALASNMDNFKKPGSKTTGKVCAYCKGTKHVRESCFLWLDTPEGSKWASKNPEKAAKTRELQKRLSKRKNKKSNSNNKIISRGKESKPTGSPDDDQSGMWVVEDHIFSSISCSKDDDVILDTGATNHVFHDSAKFYSMKKITKSIRTASGDLIPVTGVGCVRFKVFDYLTGEESKVISIEDVWCVPSCTKNLVSGTQLLKKGFKIQSSNGGLSVCYTAGQIIATARPKRVFFVLILSPLPRINSNLQMPCYLMVPEPQQQDFYITDLVILALVFSKKLIFLLLALQS